MLVLYRSFSDRPHSRGRMVKIAIQMLTMNSIGHTLRFFTHSATGLRVQPIIANPENRTVRLMAMCGHVGGPGKPELR